MTESVDPDRRTRPPDALYLLRIALPDALKLVVVEGPDEGLECPLQAPTEVGVADTCQLVLHDPAVSRRHACFSRVAGRVMVKDRDSLNGTYLGGVRVHESEVPLGAMVRLGNTTLVVQARWHTREVRPSPARRFGDLIAESTSMREQFAVMERVAPTDLTVLVEGESGTGKELAARSIHRASARADGPYVVFDCGSVPRELAESELFGHRKGAFSGAAADRRGMFQQADGGTICLDEIGELPLELQPKLLRVLETGEIRRVGDDRYRRVDVRVVAATNRVLSAEVARGRFRADLHYRLEVVAIRLPPLRHRPEDIPALTRRFLDGHIAADSPVEGENLDRLVSYSWPGNVRELRNTLLRAAALAHRPGDPEPRFEDLVLNLGPGGPAGGGVAPAAPPFPGVARPMPYKEAKQELLQAFDRAYVTALLERHGHNHTRAAEAAELSRKHLYELIRRVEGAQD